MRGRSRDTVFERRRGAADTDTPESRNDVSDEGRLGGAGPLLLGCVGLPPLLLPPLLLGCVGLPRRGEVRGDARARREIDLRGESVPSLRECPADEPSESLPLGEAPSPRSARAVDGVPSLHGSKASALSASNGSECRSEARLPPGEPRGELRLPAGEPVPAQAARA